MTRSRRWKTRWVARATSATGSRAAGSIPPPATVSKRWRHPWPRPLPSWNDGAAKSAILDFVARVTKEGGPDFVPPPERIATFDNDGTLWCEQPIQVQLFFLIDRVKELAAKDPSLKERQPFKALLEHDLKTLHGLGKQALFELAFATHAGMTEDEFDAIAQAWFAKAKHPKFGRLFKENDLPAAGRAARLSARARLQDLHRLRRRHRPHPRVRRGGLRHPARAGDRIERQAALRNAATAAPR